MMIICVSDNHWFRLGLEELVGKHVQHHYEISFLSSENSRNDLLALSAAHSVTVIIDYAISNQTLLLLLLKVKRINAGNNIIVVTRNERMGEITENILLDSVADFLIDTRESYQKLKYFLMKGDAGQVVTKSVTNKTWALLKKTSCLTHREIDLIPFIICGKGNKEISREIEISEKMVSIHRRNIYSKLHVDNLTGLYHYLTRQG